MMSFYLPFMERSNLVLPYVTKFLDVVGKGMQTASMRKIPKEVK